MFDGGEVHAGRDAEGLVGYWRLDRSGSDVAFDSGPLGNHLEVKVRVCSSPLALVRANREGFEAGYTSTGSPARAAHFSCAEYGAAKI